jgi:hypothetical protein
MDEASMTAAKNPKPSRSGKRSSRSAPPSSEASAVDTYTLDSPEKTWSAFNYFYFVNSYVAQVAPNAPEVKNLGDFHCTETKGTATYILNDQVFQRDLVFSPERSSATWLIYDEPEKRSWAFELQQNQFKCWAIWYKDDGGKLTFFQQSTRMSPSAAPSQPEIA